MRMLKRRDFLRVATGVAAGALLAACAPKPTPTPEPTKAPTTAPATQPTAETAARPMKGNMYLTGFPIVKDKVTLRFFAPHSVRVEDYNTNHFVVTYEGMTNVHIEWLLVPPSGLAEKKALAFASGDLPDCFFGAGVSANECVDYGGQGLIIPIEELIDQYCPECQKVFTETPEGKLGKKFLTAPDGHIYSFPEYTYCYHCTYPGKCWINKKWLDKVGLPVPKTTDEFHEVLKAFKAQDANANGDPNDELPFSGCTGWWPGYPTNWITNAWILDDYNSHLIIEGGKVRFSANTPEYREAMKYLAGLWKEGLIDPEAFTQDLNGLRQKVQHADYALVGCAPAYAYLHITGADTGKTDERADEYVVVPPLTGPHGASWCYYNPYTIVRIGSYVITSACKMPEVAARWIDWFYTEEGLLLNKYGRENIEWYHPKPGSGEMGHGEGLGPMPARFNWMPGKGWTETLQNITLDQGPYYEKREFRGAWTSTPENPLEPRLVEATNQYVGHEMKEVWPSDIMRSKAELEEIRQPMTQINTYVLEMTARFVTGELDVDKEWDKYVKTLDDMGLKRYMELNQVAWDRFAKS